MEGKTKVCKEEKRKKERGMREEATERGGGERKKGVPDGYAL
jgi:hypothetical protein